MDDLDDFVKRVKRAEAKAERAVVRAETKGKKIIEKETENGRKMIEGVKRESVLAGEKLISRTEKMIELRKKEMEQKTEAEMGKITNSFGKNKTKAMDAVIEILSD